MKTCSSCDESKPLSDFYKVKRNKDGYCGYCIACDKIKKAEYYENNRERALERALVWSKANNDKTRVYKNNWKKNNSDRLKQYKHKRRALESQEHFTAEEWRALLDSTGNKCLACDSTETLSADHVVPLALGGSNSIDNIQPLCVACNCKKGIKVIDYREL